MTQLVIMEQIAMYMTALPCPPLPVALSWNEESIVTSSHDLLAGLLVSAMRRNNEKLNKPRQAKQMEITERLLNDLEAAKTADAAYDACKRFTAEYIFAFDDDNRGTNLQFAAMDDVAKGSKVHMAACSWHAAQDIQHAAPEKRRNAAHFAKMAYCDLMVEHMQRVVEI
jgi:hypothetical protein